METNTACTLASYRASFESDTKTVIEPLSSICQRFFFVEEDETEAMNYSCGVKAAWIGKLYKQVDCEAAPQGPV